MISKSSIDKKSYKVAKNSKNTYNIKDVLENLVKVCSMPSIKIKTFI